MAMQAFAITVRRVKLDALGNGSKILHVHVAQPPNFRANRSIHDIVGMAGVASLLSRYTRILKVCGGHVRGVVDIEASTVRIHDVTREAELRLLGALHVLRSSYGGDDSRQQEINDERKLLAPTRGCKRGAKSYDGDQQNRHAN